MAARTPSIHVFLGRPLFLLSPGIHYIISFGSLSSCILLTWPYHWSLYLSIISIMSGFSFTPIISFICSFFILSILDFLANLLSTFISVNKNFVYFSARYLPYFCSIHQNALNYCLINIRFSSEKNRNLLKKRGTLWYRPLGYILLIYLIRWVLLLSL